MYKQQVLVNDTLNLLRGKSIRYILEDGDLRMIANLVAVVDELGLEYDPEGMVYRNPNPQHTNIPRAQLAKELEPGLNALFGAEYAQYDPSLSPEEREKKAAEAARLERNRKAREKYHAKKGKVNVRKRKTKGRK
jgi:hypothetical protein|tara:strand:- start:163 stop:567 length:405 start_codon:yes stop_codon:yes gene_type:complete